MLASGWPIAMRSFPVVCRTFTKTRWSNACNLGKSFSRTVPTRSASGASGAGGAKAPPRSKLLYIGTGGLILSIGMITYQHYDQAQVRDRKRTTPRHVTVVKNNDTADNFGLRKLTLLQFQSCPFCCKARTFLDYYGISYDKVEVNSVTKNEMNFLAYRKVPVLIFEDVPSTLFNREWTALPDSSFLISSLYNYFLSRKTISDADGPVPDVRVQDATEARELVNKLNAYAVQYGLNTNKETAALQINSDEAELEARWRRWVDDVYVHTISPNIYRTFDEAISSFRLFERVGNWAAQFSSIDRYVIVYLGAFVMWLVAGQLKKKYKLDDDVRSTLFAQTNEFLTAIEQANTLRYEKQNRSKFLGSRGPKREELIFLGGAEPNLADLAMFGAISSFDGTQAFADLAENCSLLNWYDEVKRLVESHHGRSKLQAAFSASSAKK